MWLLPHARSAAVLNIAIVTYVVSISGLSRAIAGVGGGCVHGPTWRG
jgi:hypothetical protein